MSTADVRVLHASMQFSDTNAQHRRDVSTLFEYARATGAMFVTGTEAGSDSFRELVQQYGKAFGFAVNAHKYGDWTCVSRALATVSAEGYSGPFIPGTTGKKASEGAHSPRGITWSTARVKQKGVGVITVGSAHFLTKRSVLVSGSNQPLIDGIAKWARAKGAGRSLALFCADANVDDERADVFQGEPLTTVWDELDKYPATHGIDKHRGSTIDIIASYDGDSRVSAKSARVLDDSDLKLFTDHFVVDAVFRVATS